jgi:hypothetical protein
MQPYFDPTRKTTSKKMEDDLKKKMEDDLKKMEDDLIFLVEKLE